MMKLLFSHTSPYARKVRVLIREKNLTGRVEEITVVTAENPPELLAANPLGLIPTLIREDGTSIVDSPVMCWYLDGLTDSPRLFPRDFEAQVDAMHRMAIADGMLDAALGMVMEKRRPPQFIYQPNLERRGTAIRRMIAVIEADLPYFTPKTPDIGSVALVCALEYLSFRLPELQWPSLAPHLAAWAAQTGERPSLAATRPTE